MAKRIDEETREELFQKYRRNESNNYHTENKLLLAETYGTPKEVTKLKKILKRKEELGYLDNDDYDWIRENFLPKNYYNKLIPKKYKIKPKWMDEIEYIRGIGNVYGGALPNKTIAKNRAKELSDKNLQNIKFEAYQSSLGKKFYVRAVPSKPKPTIKKTKPFKSYSEKRTPKIGKTIGKKRGM
tara:strand:- start:110 stop:661 length:552 start_codon:yes stop_codon:yes gene_type:complete